MRAAYAEAARQRYRFFSYGDAMFLAPGTIGRVDDPLP
jgi:S-adenosylmethionine:tRNA-ribosyltransferase-isomerase (queuine synthetase)